ncbi:MAG: sigma-70 family RNA polymerase sigma factor [Planctomycetes bacterium]|nr:sigma-70 family RNA polymerase sigma factor [Planctomycetota bacterium]
MQSRRLDPQSLLAHDEFVRSVARALLGNPDAADDAAQDTWLSILKLSILNKNPDQPLSIRAWLATFVRNAARDRIRSESARRRRERASARAELLPSMDAVWRREADRRAVVEAVGALAEPYRTVVLLRYFEDLTPAEIAERLGVPLETVRTRLKRAILQIREKLDGDHGHGSWIAMLLPLAGRSAKSSHGFIQIAAVAAGALVVAAKTKIAFTAVALVMILIALWSAGFGPWHEKNITNSSNGSPLASAPDAETPRAPSPETSSAPNRRIEGDPIIIKTESSPATNPAAGILVLKTIWADNKEPAPRVWLAIARAQHLNIIDAERFDSFDPETQIRTDDKGTCKSIPLPPGRYVVSTHRYTDAKVNIEIQHGASREIVIPINRGYTVTGRVVDVNNAPVAGAELWVFGGDLVRFVNLGSFADINDTSAPRETAVGFNFSGAFLGTSADDGTFTFEQISYHQFVSAYKPGHAVAAVSSAPIGVLHAAELMKQTKTSPTVPPAGKPYGEVNIIIKLADEERAISGRVIDDYTKPAVGAAVCAWPEGFDYAPRAERPWVVTLCDQNGAYTLRGLPPGKYRVEARPVRNTNIDINNDILPAPWMAYADSSAKPVENCEIRLPQGAVVYGAVVNEEGKPIPNINVDATLTNFEDGYFTSSTVTDSEGRFKLLRVVPNRVTLRAWIAATPIHAKEEVNLEPTQHFQWNPIVKTK